ncbi:MAG TPA: GNAT family N-acetyltransferase [Thermoleophilaceae bacterium]|nr:GNAT family N-acetyltransferase [Thermoleophilaceae bacterium]
MTGRKGGAALLMQRSVDAFFRMDSDGRLVESNEAFPQPAPRFFVARTSAGVTSHARRDVPAELVSELIAAAAKLPPLPQTSGVAEVYDQLAARLGTIGPVTDREIGIGYEFAGPPRPSHPEVIELGEGSDADELFAPFAAEGAELDPIGPFFAILRDGAVVSSCYSARLTDLAAEAGVDTDDEYRGRGFAAAVVNAWRVAIEAGGRTPLYSATDDNTSSRAVARRLGLRQYAETLWLT